MQVRYRFFPNLSGSDSAATPGNRPHGERVYDEAYRFPLSTEKPRPKPARSRREHLYALRKRRLLFCVADQTITLFFVPGAFSDFNPPNALTLAIRATQFARLAPVHVDWREREIKRCSTFLWRGFRKNRLR
jgi:hypothetical protein